MRKRGEPSKDFMSTGDPFLLRHVFASSRRNFSLFGDERINNSNELYLRADDEKKNDTVFGK